MLDADSNQVSLEQFLVADAMVLGRKTYEAWPQIWPQLADDPNLGVFASRMNSMPQVRGVQVCGSRWSGTPPC